MTRQIVAMGGGVIAPDTANFKLESYILAATGKPEPRVLFVPTASGDADSYVARFYESYAHFPCRAAHLPFFRRTPAELRALALAQDVIHVGGGNTRSMLAVWREWGFDAILREAWENGVVLCGSSAGAICWFDQGVTDSIAGDLTPLACLGFLAGSYCPHYDGEKDRRPAYQRMVANATIAPGYACDDGAGLHYRDDAVHAVISARPNARAYRLEREASGGARETPLEALAL